MTDFLPVAVRAYTPPTDPPKPPRHTAWKMPELVLVFDTETTIDATQRLRFGVWRVYHRGELLEEGLFHADDLPEEDLAFLFAYAKAQSSRSALRVLSRRQFLNDVGHELRTPITIVRGHLELLGVLRRLLVHGARLRTAAALASATLRPFRKCELIIQPSPGYACPLLTSRAHSSWSRSAGATTGITGRSYFSANSRSR